MSKLRVFVSSVQEEMVIRWMRNRTIEEDRPSVTLTRHERRGDR